MKDIQLMMKRKIAFKKTLVTILLLSTFMLFSCKKDITNNYTKDTTDTISIADVIHVTNKAEPLFINSIVSTDFDFIENNDPDSFIDIEYTGQFTREMPDNRNEILFDENTYVFKAKFSGNKTIEIWCHSSFGSLEESKKYTDKLMPRLGKLPTVHRDSLNHVVIHKGDETAFAENEGHFFVLYSENMDKRISTNDLEETVFHESVHASIQYGLENSEAWKNAQKNDGNYITEYARSKPYLEDMPETAIFAYTMIKHPGRLSTEIEEWIKTNIPNRLNYFKQLYNN